MKAFVFSDLIPRVRYQLRRHGLKATIGNAVRLTQGRVYLDETHIWYELTLGTDRPRVKLLSGLELVRGGPSDLPLLDELPTLSPYGARKRMEAGADLWLVLKDRRPAFACWVFHDSVPLPAARNGRLALSPEMVFFEDSVTSSAFRGRGIALAAWPKIADHIEQTTAKSIITKVEEGNVVARRAFVKSGFREIATTRFRRVGLRQHTIVRAGTGATADWLIEQLMR